MKERALILVPLLAGAALLVIALVARIKSPHADRAPLPEKRQRVPDPPPLPEPPRESSAEAPSRFFKSGSDHAAQGLYQEAVADFDRAIDLRPEWTEAYYSRGVSRMLLKDYAGAISDYDRAIALQGGGAQAYYNRALARSALGKDEEALSDYDHAIQEQSRWPEAYYNRAFLREKLGDHAGAREDGRQALQIAPAEWVSRPAVLKLISADR